jgi:hypothetical protein
MNAKIQISGKIGRNGKFGLWTEGIGFSVSRPRKGVYRVVISKKLFFSETSRFVRFSAECYCSRQKRIYSMVRNVCDESRMFEIHLIKSNYFTSDPFDIQSKKSKKCFVAFACFVEAS